MSQRSSSFITVLSLIIPWLLWTNHPVNATPSSEASAFSGNCQPPAFEILSLDPRQHRAVVRQTDGSLRVVHRGQFIDGSSADALQADALQADALQADTPPANLGSEGPFFAVHQITLDKLVLNRLDSNKRPNGTRVWMQPLDASGHASVRCLETSPGLQTSSGQSDKALHIEHGLEVVNTADGISRQLPSDPQASIQQVPLTPPSSSENH